MSRLRRAETTVQPKIESFFPTQSLAIGRNLASLNSGRHRFRIVSRKLTPPPHSPIPNGPLQQFRKSHNSQKTKILKNKKKTQSSGLLFDFQISTIQDSTLKLGIMYINTQIDAKKPTVIILYEGLLGYQFSRANPLKGEYMYLSGSTESIQYAKNKLAVEWLRKMAMCFNLVLIFPKKDQHHIFQLAYYKQVLGKTLIAAFFTKRWVNGVRSLLVDVTPILQLPLLIKRVESSGIVFLGVCPQDPDYLNSRIQTIPNNDDDDNNVVRTLKLESLALPEELGLLPYSSSTRLLKNMRVCLSSHLIHSTYSTILHKPHNEFSHSYKLTPASILSLLENKAHNLVSLVLPDYNTFFKKLTLEIFREVVQSNKKDGNVGSRSKSSKNMLQYKNNKFVRSSTSSLLTRLALSEEVKNHEYHLDKKSEKKKSKNKVKKKSKESRLPSLKDNKNIQKLEIASKFLKKNLQNLTLTDNYITDNRINLSKRAVKEIKIEARKKSVQCIKMETLSFFCDRLFLSP